MNKQTQRSLLPLLLSFNTLIISCSGGDSNGHMQEGPSNENSQANACKSALTNSFMTESNNPHYGTGLDGDLHIAHGETFIIEHTMYNFNNLYMEEGSSIIITQHLIEQNEPIEIFALGLCHLNGSLEPLNYMGNVSFACPEITVGDFLAHAHVLLVSEEITFMGVTLQDTDTAEENDSNSGVTLDNGSNIIENLTLNSDNLLIIDDLNAFTTDLFELDLTDNETDSSFLIIDSIDSIQTQPIDMTIHAGFSDFIMQSENDSIPLEINTDSPVITIQNDTFEPNIDQNNC